MAAGLIVNRFAGVVEYPVEEAPVIGAFAQGVGFLPVLATREWGVGLHVIADVGPATLDKMGGEFPAVGFVLRPGKFGRQIGEGRIDKRQ